jgi:excisionase family DNA binding protein
VSPTRRSPVRRRERTGGVDQTGVEITTGTAARIARCSCDTIVRWIEEGRFAARQFGPYGWWRIDKQSFDSYVKRYALETDSRKKKPARWRAGE